MIVSVYTIYDWQMKLQFAHNLMICESVQYRISYSINVNISINFGWVTEASRF